MHAARVFMGSVLLFLAVPVIFSGYLGMIGSSQEYSRYGEPPQQGYFCQPFTFLFWASLPFFLAASGIAIWVIMRAVNELPLVPFRKAKI